MPDYDDSQPTSDDRRDGLETPPPPDVAPRGMGPMPRQIGPYCIRRVLGSGGMGCVYEAVQERPRRIVALKVMRAGLASRSALRRFEFESQVLARLRHPGIAEVYEAGVHGEGAESAPWFAMQYIPGAKPLTDYAADRKLSLNDRLALFIKVCHAVHHGHTKAVIHRDLKPANILVDSNGEPKVIDFGVARATDADVAATTLRTEMGQLIGTVQYMSPEQIEADPHDLDTRTDVYSLGVVLYELVTGRRPYDVGRMTLLDAARVVREQSPTKLSAIDATLGGDLETIVLKALHKDRTRRYQSAQELADDVQRFLDRQPIHARPPSLAYQLRMFARRHRSLVTATAAVFVMLVASLIVTLIMYARAEQARRDAVTAEGVAVQQRNLAQEAQTQLEVQLRETGRARAIAEREAETARQINDFLNDVITSATLERMGRNVTVRAAVDAAARRIEASFKDRPAVEATLRLNLARTYDSLGESVKAHEHARRGLQLRRELFGEHDAMTIEALGAAGYMEFKAGDAELAESMLRQAVDGYKRTRGPTYAQTLQSTVLLGIVVVNRGRYSEAVDVLEGALALARPELGEDHGIVMLAEEYLAIAFLNLDRPADALPIQQRSLAALTRKYGDRIYLTVRSKLSLGMTLLSLNRAEEAEAMLRDVTAEMTRLVGPAYPDTLFARTHHARALLALERLNEAEVAASDVARLARQHFQDKQIITGQCELTLGSVLEAQGRHDDAAKSYESAFTVIFGIAGAADRERLYAANVLLNSLDSGKVADAHAIAERVLRQLTRTYGPDHEVTRRAKQSLATPISP